MKRFLKILLIIIIVVLIITTLFNIKVKHIKINGNTKQTEDELISQIIKTDFDKISFVCFIKNNVLKHKNIIHVESYDVKWETPFSIIINIYEKPDIGYIKKDIKNAYFDKDGIISDITSERKSGIPEVRGLNFSELEKGVKLEIENELMLDAVLNISSELRDYGLPLNLLEISKDNKLAVYIGNIKVELGGIKNMEIKLRRLNDIYPEIKDLSGILDLSNASDNMLDEKYIFKKTA